MEVHEEMDPPENSVTHVTNTTDNDYPNLPLDVTISFSVTMFS